MKKILIIFTAVLMTATSIYSETATERYNSEQNLAAVREISKIDGVCETAVLSRGKKVLSGIRIDARTQNTANYELVYNDALRVLYTSFPKAKKIILEIETDKALDIIELSYCIDSNIKKGVLVKRFNYLASV